MNWNVPRVKMKKAMKIPLLVRKKTLLVMGSRMNSSAKRVTML
jgi:hypothetical protein